MHSRENIPNSFYSYIFKYNDQPIDITNKTLKLKLEQF